MKKVLIGLIVLCLFIASAYCYSNLTLALVTGLGWGFINLYYIQKLIYEFLIPQQKNFLKIALLSFIKFPLLYVLGFVLLYFQNENAWGFLIGFSLVLMLGMQKKFWKIFQKDTNNFKYEPLTISKEV